MDERQFMNDHQPPETTAIDRLSHAASGGAYLTLGGIAAYASDAPVIGAIVGLFGIATTAVCVGLIVKAARPAPAATPEPQTPAP